MAEYKVMALVEVEWVSDDWMPDTDLLSIQKQELDALREDGDYLMEMMNEYGTTKIVSVQIERPE